MGKQAVSAGIRALRLSASKPEKIVVEGEAFYFKRLTLAMEEQLDVLINKHHSFSPQPPDELDADATEDEKKAYADKVVEFGKDQARAFRALTADIMKFSLLDASGEKFFAEEDDVAGMLDNVYAEKFFKAYTKFRGMEAVTADADTRFQK